MKEKNDIIITGGGMVGMSMAIALARIGLHVLVLEKTSLPAQLEEKFDGRVSALALGSVHMLQAIGAWEKMEPYAEAILDIRVCDANTPFFIHYDHRDVGKPFGYILENRHIRYGLQERALELSTLTIIENANIAEFSTNSKQAFITLSDGQKFSTSLILAADGKQSSIRKMAGIATFTHDYQQTAIVCTIAHERPHHGIAQEKFLPAGPFAVLPMTKQRSSLVWVEPHDRAHIYLNLSKQEQSEEIRQRIGDYLGEITLDGNCFSYSLSLSHTKSYISNRLALIGDAAHGIHPIAGQGVNLGFRDVAVLEELIRKQAALGLDVGASDILSHYQRWRRFDNVSMSAVTHGLNQLFCNRLLPVRISRYIGMWSVNNSPVFKNFFMKHAMGLIGDLPDTFKAAHPN